MTIKSRDPVRSKFAGCSTGNAGVGYYENKGFAIAAFNAALRNYALHLDDYDCMELHDNEGRTTIAIYDDCGVVTGRAVLSWFRMCTGRYEVIGYIA